MKRVSKKAFLLFEVAITIAILSIGLVLIVRAINMSLRVAYASFDYHTAMQCASEKLFDTMMDVELAGVEATSESGKYTQNENFIWHSRIEELSQEGIGNLGKLTLAITWKQGSREGGLEIETYVPVAE